MVEKGSLSIWQYGAHCLEFSVHYAVAGIHSALCMCLWLSTWRPYFFPFVAKELKWYSSYALSCHDFVHDFVFFSLWFALSLFAFASLSLAGAIPNLKALQSFFDYVLRFTAAEAANCVVYDGLRARKWKSNLKSKSCFGGFSIENVYAILQHLKSNWLLERENYFRRKPKTLFWDRFGTFDWNRTSFEYLQQQQLLLLFSSAFPSFAS